MCVIPPNLLADPTFPNFLTFNHTHTFADMHMSSVCSEQSLCVCPSLDLFVVLATMRGTKHHVTIDQKDAGNTYVFHIRKHHIQSCNHNYTLHAHIHEHSTERFTVFVKDLLQLHKASSNYTGNKSF